MSFDTFAFHPQINAGISTAGYSSPTPIQLKAIPPVLAGRDVLGLAQTGTGKTAAFGLPILQRLMSGPRGKLRALILAPTRELAEQTHVSISSLGRKTGLRSLTVYGGVSQIPQIKGLRGGAEIVVACPGRLLDLMGQGEVKLDAVEILVLDEADQMFDMGFLPAIRRIIAALPRERQTLLFSATMPAEIRDLATEMLRSPVTVEINIANPLKTVSHAIYPVDQTRKLDMLLELLKESGSGKVLVFTRTKHRAKKLSQQLAHAGLASASLQGNLSQNQRQLAMDGFRSGRVKILVATDIAARGIDVSQITHVINFDLPDTCEAYTHRTGRTGRMENLGTAFSLVTPDDQPMVRAIERLLGRSLERRRLEGFQYTVPQASASATDTVGADAAAFDQRSRPAARRPGNGYARTAESRSTAPAASPAPSRASRQAPAGAETASRPTRQLSTGANTAAQPSGAARQTSAEAETNARPTRQTTAVAAAAGILTPPPTRQSLEDEADGESRGDFRHPEQDRAGNNRSGANNPGQNRSRQNGFGSNRGGQNRYGQHRPATNNARPEKPGASREGSDRPDRGRSGSDRRRSYPSQRADR